MPLAPANHSVTDDLQQPQALHSFRCDQGGGLGDRIEHGSSPGMGGTGGVDQEEPVEISAVETRSAERKNISTCSRPHDMSLPERSLSDLKVCLNKVEWASEIEETLTSALAE